MIFIDACDYPARGINVKGGIKKSVTLPQDAKELIIEVIRADHDGGVRFLLEDLEGPHILGEEILQGAITKQLSYDISAWRGKTVTLEVQTFGAGTDNSMCNSGTCCGEYTGIDWIRIALSNPSQSENAGEAQTSELKTKSEDTAPIPTT